MCYNINHHTYIYILYIWVNGRIALTSVVACFFIGGRHFCNLNIHFQTRTFLRIELQTHPKKIEFFGQFCTINWITSPLSKEDKKSHNLMPNLLLLDVVFFRHATEPWIENDWGEAIHLLWPTSGWVEHGLLCQIHGFKFNVSTIGQ